MVWLILAFQNWVLSVLVWISVAPELNHAKEIHFKSCLLLTVLCPVIGWTVNISVLQIFCIILLFYICSWGCFCWWKPHSYIGKAFPLALSSSWNPRRFHVIVSYPSSWLTESQHIHAKSNDKGQIKWQCIKSIGTNNARDYESNLMKGPESNNCTPYQWLNIKACLLKFQPQQISGWTTTCFCVFNRKKWAKNTSKGPQFMKEQCNFLFCFEIFLKFLLFWN